MSDAALSRPCEPWKFWASAAWGIAAFLAWVSAQIALAFIIFAWYGQGAPDLVRAQGEAGPMAIVIALVSAPAPVLLLWAAIRRAGCGFVEYMALTRPRGLDIAIGLACLVVLLPLGDLASHLTGRDVVPPFVVQAYKLARDNGALVLLAAAFALAAPLMEELVFRGFLMRGFAASRLGWPGAIVATSLCWAAMHVQYELFFIVQIFLLGLVFGWLRRRSGSTTLTLGLHALINLSALAQTAIIIELMS
ncbi:MAG TPA: type II CAAX endopeptidase family protein [Pseudorhodoplanes sp.]|nr:type II CAAX endopeptidase family protein [Pseudorhodoplanes sp.]